MSLGQFIHANLELRAPFADRVERIVTASEGLTVSCEMCAADKMGYALRFLQVEDERGKRLDREELIQRASRICDRINYLLEPLKTIEIDQRASAALIRSVEPRAKGESSSYYEIVATGNRSANVMRYCFDHATRRRESVAFIITPEQLEMLLDDLSGQRAN